jgi:hypothetical protein
LATEAKIASVKLSWRSQDNEPKLAKREPPLS